MASPTTSRISRYAVALDLSWSMVIRTSCTTLVSASRSIWTREVMSQWTRLQDLVTVAGDTTGSEQE